MMSCCRSACILSFLIKSDAALFFYAPLCNYRDEVNIFNDSFQYRSPSNTQQSSVFDAAVTVL